MKSGEGESFAFGYFYFISKVKLELGFVQIRKIAREGFEPPTSGLWALRALQAAPPRYIS